MSVGGAALAGLAVVLAALRAVYPKLLQRRAAARRPLGPDGVIGGAEATTLTRSGAPAVLLLHGGGDTPQVLRELAEHLHQSGFSVRAPLLAKHGGELALMRAFDASEWWEQARREYDDLRASHKCVGVAGLSVGGALAVALAAERDVAALVLLAPYVALPRSVRALADTGFLWGLLFPYLNSASGGSIHDHAAAARTLGRGLTTPAALRAFARVADRADAALQRVTAPTLVIQSREDNRISQSAAERAFAKLGAREKSFVWTEGAGHVITVDFGKDRVFALATEWLKRHGA
ncbi:MAG: alpha/beta hydrolase [Candidatus Binataceae bacterium]